MPYNDDSNIIDFPNNNDDNSFDEEEILDSLFDELFGYTDGFFNEADEKLYEAWDLMQEAEYESDPEKQREYYDEAISLAPDDLEIQINYIIATNNNPVEKFSKLEAALDDYYQKNHDEIQRGYAVLENRAYFRMKLLVADIFSDVCIYKKAEKHLADVVCNDVNDSLGARYLLMALYVKFADYEKSKALFDKYSQFGDAQMYLFMATLAILTYRLDEADELIKELWKLNSNVSIFFESKVFDPEFFEYIDYEFDYFSLYGVRMLAVSLHMMSEFYVNSDFLYYYFRNQLLKYDSKHFTDAERFPELHNKASELEGEGIFKGISRQYVLSLLIAGFETKEEIENARREDILAVDGVGPATVKKLEANGIKFKE